MFDAKRPGTHWFRRFLRLIDLFDAPHTYGSAGQSLRLDSGGRTFEWHTMGGGCRVYNSGAISIPDAVATALTFDSERSDAEGMHSTLVSSGRLTATAAGVYAISGHVSFASNATGRRTVYVRLNGSSYIAVDKRAAISGDATQMSIAVMYPLVAGDYVELVVYQNAGGALNVDAASAYSPEFGMARIG